MSIALPAGLDAVLLALIGAGLLVVIRGPRGTRIIQVVVPLLCLLLLARSALDGAAVPDRAALALAVLAAFVALSEAIAAPADPAEAPWRAGLLAALLLATMGDNPFLTWLGVLGAAWCLAGRRGLLPVLPVLLMLALLGTVLLALAARPALGPGLLPLQWSALLAAAARCNGPLLGLAFAFLLAGYGGIAGLVPVQSWLSTRQGSALVLPFTNVGLLVLLRLHAVLGANPAAPGAGPPLVVLGLLSVLLAGAALWRRDDAGRFLAWIAIGQAGLAAIAFGVGGPFATLAGILQILLRTLTLTACRHAVGAAGGLAAGGLLSRRRGVALALGAALAGAAALPPSGGFGGLLLIVTGVLARAPLLAIPLGIGVIASALAILSALLALWLGAGTPGNPAPNRAAIAMACINVALALLLGLALPAALSGWIGAR